MRPDGADRLLQADDHTEVIHVCHDAPVLLGEGPEGPHPGDPGVDDHGGDAVAGGARLRRDRSFEVGGGAVVALCPSLTIPEDAFDMAFGILDAASAEVG